MSDDPSELESRLLTPAHAVTPETSEEEEDRIAAEAGRVAFNLLFVQGLYATASLTKPAGEELESALRTSAFAFDSYCKTCKRETTFRIATPPMNSRGLSSYTRPGVTITPPKLLSVSATCQRDHTVYSYILKFENQQVIKIGQWPSPADIAFGELRSIDKCLDDNDRSELGKALGLHAHDTAIGAFVYLRRVFERMVARAHQRQSAAGNPVEGFEGMRMEERIAALKGQLPEKVVQNSAVFSVLSVGLHELTEKQCTRYFPILKAVLFQMLEQEEHKRKAAITARETDAAFQGVLNELGRGEAK